MDHNDSQFRVKVGLAEMLKGGVIMDVTTADQAKIAEDAGAAAVMALERVPADIRVQGGVARMSSIKKIQEIQETVSIPVMAKVRIGHIAEARILEALEVDFIDESEVLTPADEENHISKHGFKVPFVCGCRNLGEALRRIGEGAALIRTKGEAGSGDIVEGVRHLRGVGGLQIRRPRASRARDRPGGHPLARSGETHRNFPRSGRGDARPRGREIDPGGNAVTQGVVAVESDRRAGAAGRLGGAFDRAPRVGGGD
jgi:pyridoxal biosynthesis lyase PdxS